MHRGVRKTVTKMRALERINFMREIHDHMRIREESNILNSANQQNPKKNE
jgi:hypothetical protein